MEKKIATDEIMYFEDLSGHIQDAIIDYLASIIENKRKGKQLKNLRKRAE